MRNIQAGLFANVCVQPHSPSGYDKAKVLPSGGANESMLPRVFVAGLQWERFAPVQLQPAEAIKVLGAGTEAEIRLAAKAEGQGEIGDMPSDALGRPFDVVLCSDLIYGDAASAALLVHTLR